MVDLEPAAVARAERGRAGAGPARPRRRALRPRRGAGARDAGLLAGADFAALTRDLADTLRAEDGAEALERKLDHRLATIACHHSVRAGRHLTPEEMNAPAARDGGDAGRGPCNHGRPTYVELKLADIEKLFGRK